MDLFAFQSFIGLSCFSGGDIWAESSLEAIPSEASCHISLPKSQQVRQAGMGSRSKETQSADFSLEQ